MGDTPLARERTVRTCLACFVSIIFILSPRPSCGNFMATQGTLFEKYTTREHPVAGSGLNGQSYLSGQTSTRPAVRDQAGTRQPLLAPTNENGRKPGTEPKHN